ncbi:MAG: CopG family transcriptional regulator [Acidimicrobiia bacterium]|nr:CopG family transcriptional regulator [Acidimicrobiia bacterium]
MRTTLNLDEDILLVAKQLAEQRGTTAGQVISDLVRSALEPKSHGKIRNGVLVFQPKPGAKKPNLELVNRLRDE